MNFKGIFKGSLLSYLTFTLCLFLSALLVYNNLISERNAGIIVFGGIVVGCFLGALGAAKASDSKILFNALMIGAIFSLTIIIASSAVNDGFVIHTKTMCIIISAFAASFFGAIFGK